MNFLMILHLLYLYLLFANFDYLPQNFQLLWQIFNFVLFLEYLHHLFPHKILCEFTLQHKPWKNRFSFYSVLLLFFFLNLFQKLLILENFSNFIFLYYSLSCLVLLLRIICLKTSLIHFYFTSLYSIFSSNSFSI